MTIHNLQVQSLLRTYDRQQAEGGRLSRDRVSRKYLQQDDVKISAESKKRLLAEKISREVVSELASGSEPNANAREIMYRLRQEYGEPLAIGSEDGENMVFKVPRDKGMEALPPAENERLQKRLIDITQRVIYDHLA